MAKSANTPPSTNTAPQAPQGLAAKTHHHLSLHFSNLTKALITVVIVAAVAAGTAYGLANKKVSQQPAPAAPAQQTTVGVETKLPEPKVIPEITYLEKAKALPDLHFFKNTTPVFGESCDSDNKCGPDVKGSDITYYKVGRTKDGNDVLVFIAPSLSGGRYFALKTGVNKYEVLAQMDRNLAQYHKEWDKSLADNVTINLKYKLTGIDFPSKTDVAGQSLVANDSADYRGLPYANLLTEGLKSLRGQFYSELKGAPVVIGTSGDLDFYQAIVDKEPTFNVVEIYGIYQQLFSYPYVLAEDPSDSSTPSNITWTAGESNKSIYFSGGQGCGAGQGYVVAKGFDKDTLIKVGKLGSRNLYQLPSGSDLVQEIYHKDYGRGSKYLTDKSLRNLTIQQMTDKHAYYLMKNELGEWMLFQRDDMFQRGGCAKPVVYLYPTKPTDVSVRVGADVTISDPSYGEGWNNIWAQPNGQLAYKGQSYDSLFWEGYGHGRYPEIMNGTIVKTSQAAETVKLQLVQQGLNAKEIQDFMDYWGPKLETDKPYTRLTWFGTAQMNQLAPLDISPIPNTLLRVFLDFEGLDSKPNLPTEQFRAPVRNGFTVVEWGGLARNGLIK